MKDKKYKIIVVILYIISFLLLLFSIRLRLDPGIFKGNKLGIIILIITCILLYINGYILVYKLKYNKKILKINLVLYFIIYTITICTLMLFDEIYGRNGLVIVKWDKQILNNYLKYYFNIIPFDTIKLYINGYSRGIVSFKNFSMNIIGNFCVFMPYGVFLPLMFKRMNKYYRFLITMVITVVIIELLQFITMSGSCDVDDLILNVLGASIVYFIYKIKFIHNLINKMFLFE